MATEDVDLPQAVTLVECRQSSAMQPDLLRDRSDLAVAALGQNGQQTGRAEMKYRAKRLLAAVSEAQK